MYVPIGIGSNSNLSIDEILLLLLPTLWSWVLWSRFKVKSFCLFWSFCVSRSWAYFLYNLFDVTSWYINDKKIIKTSWVLLLVKSIIQPTIVGTSIQFKSKIIIDNRRLHNKPWIISVKSYSLFPKRECGRADSNVLKWHFIFENGHSKQVELLNVSW